MVKLYRKKHRTEYLDFGLSKDFLGTIRAQAHIRKKEINMISSKFESYNLWDTLLKNEKTSHRLVENRISTKDLDLKHTMDSPYSIIKQF